MMCGLFSMLMLLAKKPSDIKAKSYCYLTLFFVIIITMKQAQIGVFFLKYTRSE